MATPKESYFRESTNEVSQSEQLDDDVIADYDERGRLVGLEFLDPSAAEKREEYLALAKRKAPGTGTVSKPPESDSEPGPSPG